MARTDQGNEFLTNAEVESPATPNEELRSSLGSHDELGEYEEDADGSNHSESSESEHEIDETVREDMIRLEETFMEIGMKFRMIDRIGEGICVRNIVDVSFSLLTQTCRDLFNSLQSRRLTLRLLSERLGHRI